jgi:hypothetical protein
MVKRLFVALICVIISSCAAFADGSETGRVVPDWAVVSEGRFEDTVFFKPDVVEEPPQEVIPAVNEYVIRVNINPETREVSASSAVTYHNRTGAELHDIGFVSYFSAFTEEYAESRDLPYFADRIPKIFNGGEIEYAKIDFLAVTVQTEEVEFYENGCALFVILNEPLPDGESIVITLDFEAYIPPMNHRTGANEHAMWFAHFFPFIAGFEDGKWRIDKYYPAGDLFAPEFANYTLEIITPAGFEVIGTGDIVAEETESERVSRVRARSVRDVAFAVGAGYGRYQIETGSGKLINVRAYSEEANAEAFADAARRIIEGFTLDFGDYRESTFDIIETGYFLEGAEGFTACAFVDTGYLLSEPPYNELKTAVARQWFYALAGSDTVREPWLDRGLPSYLHMRVVYSGRQLRESAENAYEVMSEFAAESENARLSGDLGVYGSFREFDAVQNTRARLMLYSLENLMGSAQFNEFIRVYVKRFSHKIAAAADFTATAEEFFGECLEDFFEQWSESETLPPLIHATEG